MITVSVLSIIGGGASGLAVMRWGRDEDCMTGPLQVLTCVILTVVNVLPSVNMCGVLYATEGTRIRRIFSRDGIRGSYTNDRVAMT
jgi:hypothetical protein